MMKIALLTLILAAFQLSSVLAQEKGRLEVVEDPRISALQKFRAQALTVGGSSSSHAERTPGNRSVARGFRVQIYMGRSEERRVGKEWRYWWPGRRRERKSRSVG